MKYLAFLFTLVASTPMVCGQTDASEKWAGFKDFKTVKVKKLSHFSPKDFKYIEGGVYSLDGLDFPLKKTEQDSCLIMDVKSEITNLHSFRANKNKSTIHSFYLSDHEVTNEEYRKFVLWVKEYTARKILAKHYPDKYLNEVEQLVLDQPVDWKDSILQQEMYGETGSRFGNRTYLKTEKLSYKFDLKVVIDTVVILDTINNDEYFNEYISYKSRQMSCSVYPDTFCWISDFQGSFLEPFVRKYYSHPFYDDYPVVGISWFQAQAYCTWLTYRTAEDKFYSLNGFRYNGYFEDNDSLFQEYRFSQFRLPTENEFIYASMPKEKWLASNFLGTSKQQANSGAIIDVNGIMLKSYDADGYSTTSPIKSYKPNQYGIYDLHGNVSEWTANSLIVENPYKISSNDGLEAAVNTILSSELYQFNLDVDTVITPIMNLVKKPTPIWVEDYANGFLSNSRLIDHEPNGKIVKGGNWFQGPIYLMPEVSSLHSAESSRSTIGFRVVMDHPPLWEVNPKSYED